MPTADLASDRCAALVDLDRYPLLEPEGEAMAAVLGEARSQLGTMGWCELPGFVRASQMSALIEDARALAPLAWHSSGMGTAYLAAPGPEVAEGDPRRWAGPYGTGAVAYDLFPEESLLRQLYEWEPLRAFVEAILGRGTIHRYADPCGALNLAVMSEGEQLQWHFDQTDFVVSLAIQDAEEGGDFEVVPLIREEGDEHFDDVAAVLAGTSDRVETIEMVPGTLLVFEGRRSIHRVSPIDGEAERLVGLLAYDTRPGTVSSDALRRVRYGR